MTATDGQARALKPRPDGYIRRVINGQRLLEHVFVWQTHFGKVPEGYQIHHKNGKRADNRIENLEVLTPLEHRRTHSGCYRDDDGHWVKPCRVCGEFKSVRDHYYHRRRGGIEHECKACKVRRNVMEKQLRRLLESKGGVA